MYKLLLTLTIIFFLSTANAECRKDTIYYYSFSLYDAEKFNESRVINSYDVNNNLLEYLGQTWNSNSKKWDNSTKKIFTFDANNNQLTEINTKWNNAWINEKKFNWTYDQNKNKLTELYQTWNLTTTAWVDGSKTDWTYNANKQIIVQTSYSWNTINTSWVGNTRLTFTYDGNGNNTVLLTEGWLKTKNKWGSSSKYTNTFNGNYLSVKLYQLADTFGNFKDRQKFVFTYDANNNVIDQTTYFGSGNLVISGKFLYQYDANDNRTQEIKQRYYTSNSTYENISKINYLYHSNKIKIAEYYETWDVNKSSWLKSARDSFELNINNDIKAIDHQYNYSYFYNTYGSHTREEFICTYIINSTNTEPISIYEDLKIYPNPIQSNHFKIYINEKSTYSILDMQGKRVQNGILNAGINQIEIPSTLINGIYFIKMGNTIQKIIIQQ